MNICWFLMILAKKVDYGQKIRFCEKKVGNFSTSKCSKNCAFRYFSKKKFLRGSFRLKKRPLKGFCEKTKRTVFLTIFVNLQKRLETAVLEGHCKFSMKSIIWNSFRMKCTVGTFALGPWKDNYLWFIFRFKQFFLTFLVSLCRNFYTSKEGRTKFEKIKKSFSPKFFRSIQNVK